MIKYKFLHIGGLIIFLVMLSGCTATATIGQPPVVAPTATTLPATVAPPSVATPPIRQPQEVAPTATPLLVSVATNTPAPTVVGTKLPSQPKLATTAATIKTATGKAVSIVIELARSSQEQQFGLMGRYQMGANEGMLFIFPSITTGSFWMKNTPLPLSIAFIDSQNKIVDIQEMKPLSEELTNPKAEYLLALEMNQGFFARNSIKVGDVLVSQR